MKKTATDLDSLSPFQAALEQSRGSAGELGNHAIDEFKAGRLSRRELLRHASLLGLSMAAGGLIGMPHARAQRLPGKPGGTIRVAHLTPAGAVDPLTVNDAAGLALINQTGEFLSTMTVRSSSSALPSRSPGSRTRRAMYGRSSYARTSSSTTVSP